MKDSILEKALLQAQALEEAVKANAKGILASTMKQEIAQLVKESVENEKPESDDDESDDKDASDVDASNEPENDDDTDTADAEGGNEMPDFGGEGDTEDEEDQTDDVTGVTDVDDTTTDDEDSTDELPSGDDDENEFTPFGDEDGDGEDEDDEIDLTNSDENEILSIFKKMSDEDGITVTQKGDDEVELSIEEPGDYVVKLNEEEEMCEDEETEEEMAENLDMEGSNEETLYEITFDDEDEDSLFHDHEGMEGGLDHEGMDHEGLGGFEGEGLEGVDDPEVTPMNHFGHDEDNDEFAHEPNVEGGMDEFIGDEELYEEDEVEGDLEETARTIGLGNRPNALKKGMRTPAVLNKENVEMKKQLAVLREKNEEYKKALNLFREKLNEVAVFNANLAYATRLFTEHSTTKQEKLDILKRFDETTTLKESKNLYKVIKTDLNKKATVNETVAEKIAKNPAKGSTNILSESKAYQSPQFERMKDLFNKLNNKNK